MTWRQAQDADVPHIDEFLSQRIQTSMFPLANLRDHGLHGPRPRAMNIWILGDEPRAVFGITNEGMVLPQCPGCSDQEIADAIDLIRGRKLFGLAAEAVQARRIMQLAGWEGRPATLNSDEPGFSLDLEQLVLPDAKGAELVPLGEVDRLITQGWRESYLIEAMDFDPGRALKQADEDYLAYTSRDSHRVLLIDGQPAAMTGFNARLPEIVQTGRRLYAAQSARSWLRTLGGCAASARGAPRRSDPCSSVCGFRFRRACLYRNRISTGGAVFTDPVHKPRGHGMSFIRPEAKLTLWRWREVLVAGAVLLVGLAW